MPPQSRHRTAESVTAGWPTHSNDQFTPPPPNGPSETSLDHGTISRICCDSVALAGVDEVCGAEFEGERALGGQGVDGDDRLCCLDPQRLDDREADPSGTEDSGVIAGLDVRPVEDRADARDDAAGDQASRGQRDLLVDRDRLHLLDDRQLGEGGGRGEISADHAADREGLRAVADRLLAPRRVAGVAPVADAAVRDRTDDDVVARLGTGDLAADLLDDPGAFVAHH